MALPLSRPSLRREDFDTVLDAMVHDRLTSGEVTRFLCREITKTLGLKEAVLSASVNDAIHFVFQGLGLRSGDKVILSPLAPQYWVTSLVNHGLIPVFADVEADSPVLDPKSVESLLTEKTCAVVADTCLGYLPHFESLKKAGLFVIEDFSQGIGGKINGLSAGMFGDGVIANFTPESLVAGAGGCLAGLRISPKSEQRIFNPWESLSDLGSALILSQWKDSEVFAIKKKDNFRYLFQRLPKGYRQPKQCGDGEPVNPWFPVLLDSGAKDVLSHSRKKAVESDWAFRNQPQLNSESDLDFCPNARAFLFHTLIFPLYSTFSTKELELLGKVISSLP